MKFRVSCLLICVFAACAVGFYWHKTRLQRTLANSPSLILYSLNPNRLAIESTQVSERAVDQVVISDASEKAEVLDAVQQTLALPPVSYLSSCFAPRHAVSTLDGKTAITICFECNQAQIDMDGSRKTVSVNRDAKPLFQQLIRKYHLKTID